MADCFLFIYLPAGHGLNTQLWSKGTIRNGNYSSFWSTVNLENNWQTQHPVMRGMLIVSGNSKMIHVVFNLKGITRETQYNQNAN